MSNVSATATAFDSGQVPVPADAGPDGFVKFLQNNDELQVVATLSNIAGVIGAPAALLGLISIFKGGQPDNSAVLSAISQLQETLQSDFETLGDLIAQQAQLTRDTVNRDTMAAALANSGLAANAIQNFLSNGETDALETAKNYSTLGFEYFTSLNLTSTPDLAFFMPGFIKAGTIRMFVLASEPLSAREAQSVFIGDIGSMVTLLTSMIKSLQSTTDANHVLITKSHTVNCPVNPRAIEASTPALPPPHSKVVTVIDGYSHEEKVVATDGSGNVTLISLGFFDAQQGNPQCEQPSGLEKEQLAAAQQARSQGVTSELAYIGVPYFEQILQAWTAFLTAATTPPITTVLNLSGTWITGDAPGPVIAVNGNALSIDLSVYRRPSAFGSILDSSDITVTFPDDNTYTAVLQPPGTISGRTIHRGQRLPSNNDLSVRCTYSRPGRLTALLAVGTTHRDTRHECRQVFVRSCRTYGPRRTSNPIHQPEARVGTSWQHGRVTNPDRRSSYDVEIRSFITTPTDKSAAEDHFMRVRPKESSRSLVLSSIVCASCLGIAGLAWAQLQPTATPLPKPNVSADPLLRGFEFRSIGPAVMMGRIDDIVGSEKDPMIMFIAFATGGLWKTADGGIHWKSLMDELPHESVGAIGLSASNPDIVYAGMGEANNRQSSSIGDGIWGSRDGGKTWTHLGLEKVQSIARVAVDPTNPDIVYVAANGHLFGPNPERGLYKTTDGGKTWKNMKYIDPDTGFTDVSLDLSNPKIVYAASFMRRRSWFGYNGGGPTSALWKSTNAGESWTKLDGPGWPKPKDGIYGRIAMSVFRAKPNIVYAQVEAGASAGTGGGTTAEGGPARGGRGGAAGESAAPGGEAATGPGRGATPPAPAGVPEGNAQPGGGVVAATGGGGGRGGIPAGPPDPNRSGVFRSEDGGKTWKFMSNQDQRPTYFSQIRVDPVNDQKIFVGGTPAQMSMDGGKTWKPVEGSHTDYHAFWINPKDPRVVAVGHDGGLDISNDGGLTWGYHNDIAVGQFYQLSADMRRPYVVCGGLQDNNAWCAPSALRSTTGPVNTDWFTVSGGDGFYTRQDPLDWATVYAESQDGSMSRLDLRAGTQKSIRPTTPVARGAAGAAPAGAAAPTANEIQRANNPPAGVTPPEGTDATAAGGGRGVAGGGRGGPPNVYNALPSVEPLRFYWNAPFEMSPHNPQTVYMASQYFFKSTNRGDTWWMNPTDLTKKIDRWSPERGLMGVAGDKPMAEKHDGYSASSLITQLRESPSRPGVIWIGTDDGNLHVSQDGGESFTKVDENISGSPKGFVQISRIEPSHFDPATAYVALDNHRCCDDWKPYLFKTTDYGKTWTTLTNNLPAEGNINALREDYDNPDLLFVGTEFGLYVTLDGGKDWKKFMTNLPSVRVDDILIHPRDRDLIVATHGRSIWIADDISPLEKLHHASGKELTLFEPRPAVLWKNDPQAQRHVKNFEFEGKNPQGGTAISVLANADAGAGKLEFLQNDKVVSTMDVQIKTGLNRFQWNMRGPAPAGAGRGGGRGAAAAAAPPTTPAVAGAATPAVNTGVPFVAAGGRGGGGGGGGGGGRGGPVLGPVLEPGSYMVRLTAGGQTITTSVDVLEDIWMARQ